MQMGEPSTNPIRRIEPLTHRACSAPILPGRGNNASLSPRERAGVRGKDALSNPNQALSHIAKVYGEGRGEISPNNSRIEPPNHCAYSAPILQRRGNNVSLSLGGYLPLWPGWGEGARALDRCSNFPVHREGRGEISSNNSLIEPLNHRKYNAPILPRRGNDVSLSLGGEGRGEGARTLDRCSNFSVPGEGTRTSNNIFLSSF